MEYQKNNYLKQFFMAGIVFLLIFSLIGQSVLSIDNNSGLLSGLDTDVRLETVSIEETEKESMTWTEVAGVVMPSVVAILSYDGDTGATSSGSGIIISEDGLIVTNAHVVDSIQNVLTVILADETDETAQDNPSYEATLIGMDEYTDLAVLKIEATGLTPAEFGDSDELEIAQGVMAVGFPGGLDLSPSATVTIGYVSAVSRPIDMGDGYVIKSIQTDASINPGNSGGALVNSYGQVIGIPSSKIVETGYEGLGFAIPSTIAETIVNDLIEYGYVQNRATIGVGGTIYNEYVAQYYNVPAGLYVQDIYAEATENSGLQVEDFITKVEGVKVDSINIINYYLQQKLPGEYLSVEIYRDGEYMNLEILLSDFNDVYNK